MVSGRLSRLKKPGSVALLPITIDVPVRAQINETVFCIVEHAICSMAENPSTRGINAPGSL
jgi:hypothetical protein